ncbi:hypothetical protein pdam_00014156 [Pocillopora damicornis]|uniref:Serine-threonine/tyrosine-protein kinase catalytic domain-containing protein n=1 Tax=Pocillopora damicornis TaxID=46731 RepID=A0A3M6TMW7_POCDA|nr:hypothetical protein pdam_00014156 [Pocillopora damicornis]
MQKFEEKRKLKPSVETKETNQGSNDDNLRIFLPTVTVSLLTIVVCIIIFLLWRRHRDDMETLVEPPAFSMRDKLRAESLKSFDTLLSRHFDPNRLRQYRLDHVHYVKDLGVGSFGKGIHLGQPRDCPDFVYAIMKDCWHEDPKKRLEFSEIQTRLSDPFNSNYGSCAESNNQLLSENMSVSLSGNNRLTFLSPLFITEK